jgi:hypothetical protein
MSPQLEITEANGLKQCPGCRLICAWPKEFTANRKVCVHCQRRMNKTPEKLR